MLVLLCCGKARPSSNVFFVSYYYRAERDRSVRPPSVLWRIGYFQVDKVFSFDPATKLLSVSLQKDFFMECLSSYSRPKHLDWRKGPPLDRNDSQLLTKGSFLASQTYLLLSRPIPYIIPRRTLSTGEQRRDLVGNVFVC